MHTHYLVGDSQPMPELLGSLQSLRARAPSRSISFPDPDYCFASNGFLQIVTSAPHLCLVGLLTQV